MSRISVLPHAFHSALATSLRLPNPAPEGTLGVRPPRHAPRSCFSDLSEVQFFCKSPVGAALPSTPFTPNSHGKPPPCSMLADLLLISCSSPDFSENCKNQLSQCHPQAQPLEHLEATVEFLCQQHRGSPMAGREPHAGPTLWGVRCLRLENKTVPSASSSSVVSLASRNRVGRSFSHLSYTT